MLVCVFHLLSRRPRGDPRVIPDISWIQVTHVCRLWRDVALSYPRLWGHIVLNIPGAVKGFLARSNGAPLYIWRFGAGPIKSKQQEAFGLVIRQLSRIRTIRIDAYDLTMFSFPKVESISASLLETCILRGAQYLVLLDVILGCDLPRLKQLEIPPGYPPRVVYTPPPFDSEVPGCIRLRTDSIRVQVAGLATTPSAE